MILNLFENISNLSKARGTCPANAGNTGVIPKDRILKYNNLEKKFISHYFMEIITFVFARIMF